MRVCRLVSRHVMNVTLAARPRRAAAWDARKAAARVVDSAAADAHDVQVARGSVGAQSLGAAGPHAGHVDPGHARVGDEHVTGAGGVAHARGDIDIDAEVIAAELARGEPQCRPTRMLGR